CGPTVLATGPTSRPFKCAIHAHNDYEQARPLFDALDAGARSVEADIHLVNGQLLVAHRLSEVQADRSLQSLYLDPLQTRIKEHDGSVYGDGETLILLLDMKTEPALT